MPPSAMTGMPYLAAIAGGVVHGGDLGHADTGHHAGGADGAGADANLHAVGARLDQGLGALGGGHVAGDELHIGIVLLHLADSAPECRCCGRGRSPAPARPPGPLSARPRGPARRWWRRWQRRTAGGRLSSLAELGYCTAFSISLMVIRPFRRMSSSTMGSFSMRVARAGSPGPPPGWCPPGR